MIQKFTLCCINVSGKLSYSLTNMNAVIINGKILMPTLASIFVGNKGKGRISKQR